MKTLFIYHYLCCSTLVALLCLGETVVADEEKVKNSNRESPLCATEVLMTFFPQPIVKDILVKHQIPLAEAEAIAQELSQKNRDITKLLENQVIQLDSSSFRDINRREIIMKASKEALYDVFATVLKSHGITDDNQIHVFLDDMQEAKRVLFIQCIRQDQLQRNEIE